MKMLIKLGLATLIAIFTLTQCEKNAIEPEAAFEDQDAQLSTLYAEVETLNVEMEVAEDSSMTDTSATRIKRRLWWALDRLDAMLDKVLFIVMSHDSDSAKTLYDEAKEAQHNAIEAAKIDSFHLAFDYIHESRYYAWEAVKIIREEHQEQLEQIIARLREEMEQVDILLDEVRQFLEQNPHELAEFLYNRGRRHQALAVDTFMNAQYRRTAYHLLRAKKYARRALHILNPE